MSEYEVKHEGRWHDNAGYSVYLVIAPDGKAVREFDVRDFDYVSDAKQAAYDYANEHNLAYFRKEIASLQQANAELLQAMEAQSEKLGEARQFIRDIADLYAVPHGKTLYDQWEAKAFMYDEWKQKAEDMQAQWESEVVTAESEAE